MLIKVLFLLSIDSFLKRAATVGVKRFSSKYLHMSNSNLNLYQIDAYLKSCTSNIVSRVTHSDDSQTLVLDDTVLYAEGGGQPYDFGTVNGISVQSVVKSPEATGKNIEVKIAGRIDPDVSQVECIIDWKRRYDFMQQHSAQVFINIVLIRTVQFKLTQLMIAFTERFGSQIIRS